MNITFRRGRGFTMTEVLVVLALCGIVTSLAAALLAQMLRVEGDARRAGDENREFSRLAISFRRDAHQATGMALEESGGQLTFTLAKSREVGYSARAGRVDRIVREAENAEQVIARDSFRLSGEGSPVVANIRFQREPLEEAGELAAMVVAWKDEQTRRPLAPLRTSRIEAKVARDLELTSSTQRGSP